MAIGVAVLMSVGVSCYAITMSRPWVRLLKFEKLRKLEGGGRLETKVTGSYVSRLGGRT